MLTFQILHRSKTAFPWPIYLILKASPTNSGLVVILNKKIKGSGGSIYLEIAPNFALKEHYSPIAHRSLNRVIPNFGRNKNSFMKKIIFCELWETCEILISNFTSLTCMENLRNLEGSGFLHCSCRGVNSSSIVIFRVNTPGCYCYCAMSF